MRSGVGAREPGGDLVRRERGSRQFRSQFASQADAD